QQRRVLSRFVECGTRGRDYRRDRKRRLAPRGPARGATERSAGRAVMEKPAHSPAPHPDPQNTPQPAASALLDRSDVRVKHATGVRETVAAFVDRVRSGDLGSLPAIAGRITLS